MKYLQLQTSKSSQAQQNENLDVEYVDTDENAARSSQNSSLPLKRVNKYIDYLFKF